MPLLRLLLLSLFLVFFNGLFGQSNFRIGPGVFLGDSSQIHELILVDYSTMLGNCISITGDQVLFRLRHAAEATEIPMKKIRFLGLFLEQESEREGKSFFTGDQISFSDATYHRTALPMEGKGRVRMTELAYIVSEFNLNKNVQLGAGLLLPVGFLITQRLRVGLSDRFHLGVSNQAVWVTIDAYDGSELAGDLNLNLTIGDSDRFLNLGGGFLYNLGDDFRPAHLNLTMGERLSDRWHLYGEISVIDDRFDVIIIPAINASQSTRRHRWRFGIFTVFDTFQGSFLPLPLVGYEYYW